MIKLKDLLSENLKFQHGHDSDRPTGAKSVFVFHPNDVYVKEGKTHGLVSHAIKHLAEFDSALLSKVIASVNSIIRKSPNSILLNANNKPLQNIYPYPYPPGIIMNVLDMVNDKVVLKKRLRDEETEIFKYLTAMTDEYESILQSVIQKSVDVTNLRTVDEIKEVLKTTDVIKFVVESRDASIFVVTDIKDSIIILISNDGLILSGYRPSFHKKKWSGFQRLQKYFSSTSVTVKNPLIQQLFGLE